MLVRFQFVAASFQKEELKNDRATKYRQASSKECVAE